MSADTAPLAAGQGPPLWKEAGGVLLLFSLSAVALAWAFPAPGFGPLVFVALAPWAATTCGAHRAWVVHWSSFAVGWAFFLVTLRWLQPVTGLGFAALAFYLALYWVLAGWALRTARRHGIALVWSVPIAWVACEYLRATVMTGFPWLFLAHALYTHLYLIQISDLVGAYGVTFAAAMVNGAIAELLLHRWRAGQQPPPGGSPSQPAGRGARPDATAREADIGPRQRLTGVSATTLLIGTMVVYGTVRLAQRPQSTSVPPPRVAVIQHDFPLVSRPPYSEARWVVLTNYMSLAAKAARHAPDLLVFPETVWGASQNIDFVEKGSLVPELRGSWSWATVCHQIVSAFARGDYRAANAEITRLEHDLWRARELPPQERLPRLPNEPGTPTATLIGAIAVEQYPEATYPKTRSYNSALLYHANGVQQRERYDKVHLVPFGEVVPFRQATFLGLDLHWLYRGLNRLSPFSHEGRVEYSLTAGDEFSVLEFPAAGRTYRFGVPICYEDAMPYIARRFVWDGPRRRVDFLVNISNDGWFQHSTELPQHLAICAFRAVENRVAIARAVNTGISGFIDPDGRIFSRVRDAHGRYWGPGVVGYGVESVPLDNRISLYGRWGDWFAQACLVLTALLWASAVFERWILAIRQRVRVWLAREAV